MNDILKIENLICKDILKDISFFLKEKSFNILMGSNGSGKTTLVKCIVGLLEYKGNITYKNNYINDENLKEIGVLSEFSLPLSGNAFSNIMYPLSNLKYNEAQAKKKIYELSKKLDIENLLLKDIKDLSLCEKKIVLFAIAIIHDPNLIIIDDSFDELDNYYRNKIIKYLKTLKNKTILFITNNVEDLKFADNAIVLNKGKLIFNGECSELLKNERIVLKTNSSLPFLADLSSKLKLYDLLDDLVLDEDEMVNQLWK